MCRLLEILQVSQYSKLSNGTGDIFIKNCVRKKDAHKYMELVADEIIRFAGSAD